jgi:hypothetical protein
MVVSTRKRIQDKQREDRRSEEEKTGEPQRSMLESKIVHKMKIRSFSPVLQLPREADRMADTMKRSRLLLVDPQLTDVYIRPISDSLDIDIDQPEPQEPEPDPQTLPMLRNDSSRSTGGRGILSSMATLSRKRQQRSDPKEAGQ